MTPKPALTATPEPRLTVEAQARLLVEIREELARLEAEGAKVREALTEALLDHDGVPLDAGPYRVSLIAPKPRQVLDARKLLEAGVTGAQLERGRVERPVAPYPQVRLRGEGA